MKEVKLSPLLHKGEACIKVEFALDNELQNCMKNFPGRIWSSTHKSWYVKDVDGMNHKIEEHFKGKAYVKYFNFEEKPLRNPVKLVKNPKEGNVPTIMMAQVSEHNYELIKKLKFWMKSKRYSDSTIVSYVECLELFSRCNKNLPLQETGPDDIISFNNEYVLKKKLSASYQSHFISAIRLLFKVCCFNRLVETDLVRPKKPKRLPNVLSKEEVKQLLQAPKNIKHKAMLSLVYSCGLRCGELLRLKPEHVSITRNLLLIKQAKGRKDRISPLSNKTIELLKEYLRAYSSKIYLFEGKKEGEMYDERSLQNVLKQSLTKAGIKKPVTLHWLRHSYATHLLEAGTNLRCIQEILGHKSPITTQIYTHVSTAALQNVRSPFDSL